MRNTPEPQVRNDTIRDVAREARAELSSIDGYIGLLIEDLAHETSAVDDLGKIRLASKRVLGLVAHLEEQVDSARELANIDPLTGVANRRTLVARGSALFRSDAPLSILLIDVDKFKQVNDRYGHLTGDQVLKILVDRCGRAVRETDLIARFAGDEFVILLPNTPMGEAERVAARVLSNVVTEPFDTSFGAVDVSVSVGVASREPTDETMDGLMARADRAMYDAKQRGGAGHSRL